MGKCNVLSHLHPHLSYHLNCISDCLILQSQFSFVTPFIVWYTPHSSQFESFRTDLGNYFNLLLPLLFYTFEICLWFISLRIYFIYFQLSTTASHHHQILL